MKHIFFALFLAGAASFTAAHAQVKVNISVNIDSQPDWGLTGYDHVDYYYLPDIDCYYDVPNRQYVYFSNNVWRRSAALPVKYKNYDVYKGYKVVINSPRPYLKDKEYKARYESYKGHASGPIIRDSHEERYKKAQGNHGHHYGEKRH